MNPETCGKQARKSYPKLWEKDDESSSNNKPSKKMPSNIAPDTDDSFHWARSVRNTELPSSGLQFAFTINNDPFLIRLGKIISRSLVVAHQFSMSTLFLVGHRCVVCRSVEESNEKYCEPCLQDNTLLFSMHGFTITLIVIALSTMIARRCNQTTQIRRKRDRLHSRSVDAILIAGILRFLSSVLRTLTASYSSDTVTALAIGGMISSVASADYDYANGISRIPASKHHQQISTYEEKQRQTFLGGTVSINCVFFSAALLASRLPSDTVSYIFFMWTVILFAYYPEARFLVAQTKFGNIGESSEHKILKFCIAASSHELLTNAILLNQAVSLIAMVGTSISSFLLLNNGLEMNAFIAVQSCILIVAPVYKTALQKHKAKISGPWDIAHIKVEE
jgi:hypothetical protein